MKEKEHYKESFKDLIRKLEQYCSYQERCHKEVEEKMRQFVIIDDWKNELIAHLIENNYINEERFAKSFVRGKFFYKHWGKKRIVMELKYKEISKRTIDLALKELPDDVYKDEFDSIAQKYWNRLTETGLKKQKKFTDYFLRKGFEYELISGFLKKIRLLL